MTRFYAGGMATSEDDVRARSRATHGAAIAQAGESSERAIENVATAPGGSAWHEARREQQQQHAANARYLGVMNRTPAEHAASWGGEQFAGAPDDFFRHLSAAQQARPVWGTPMGMTNAAVAPMAAALGRPGFATAEEAPIGMRTLGVPWHAGLFEGGRKIRATMRRADEYHAQRGGMYQARSPYSRVGSTDDDED